VGKWVFEDLFIYFGYYVLISFSCVGRILDMAVKGGDFSPSWWEGYREAVRHACGLTGFLL
jgi:hypothetical protein